MHNGHHVAEAGLGVAADDLELGPGGAPISGSGHGGGRGGKGRGGGRGGGLGAALGGGRGGLTANTSGEEEDTVGPLEDRAGVGGEPGAKRDGSKSLKECLRRMATLRLPAGMDPYVRKLMDPDRCAGERSNAFSAAV